MVDINRYLADLKGRLMGCFGERVVFIGLQGSYLRGEATETSDIDVMVVWDRLFFEDLEKYKEILISAGNYHLSCGFVCGADDLKRWNAQEACHVLHSTKDIHGRLAELLPKYTREDAANYIKLSAGNIYHELCHRLIHEERRNAEAALPAMYKAAFFVLQDLEFLRSGVFCETRAELAERLKGEDKAVLEALAAMQCGDGRHWDGAFRLLFDWCKKTLAEADSR